MTSVPRRTLRVTDVGATASGLANRFLVPLLGAGAGRRLGRRLAVVEYSGRRTGRRHQLVTLYTAHGRTVRIGVGRPRSKTWWRNFETSHPIRLRLAGADYDGVAHLERAGATVIVVAVIQHAAGPRRSAGATAAVAAGGLVPLWLMLRNVTDAGRRPEDAPAARGGGDVDTTFPEAVSGAQPPWDESPAPPRR